MVVELQGFGPVPGGAEDPGNESEAELDTSKMVQVGKLQSCKNLGSVVALLQGNFEKVLTLRQIMRENAQF